MQQNQQSTPALKYNFNTPMLTRLCSNVIAKAIESNKQYQNKELFTFLPDDCQQYIANFMWDSKAIPCTTIKGPEDCLDIVYLNNNELHLATNSSLINNTCTLWKVVDTKPKVSSKFLLGPQQYSKISPDGKIFFKLSPDDTAQLIETATGKCLAVLYDHDVAISKAKFSLDSSKLVVIINEKIDIWCSKTGECIKTIIVENKFPRVKSRFIRNICVSADGVQIAFVAANKIKVFNTETEVCTQEIAFPHLCIKLVQFSPDGTKLIAADDDMIHIIDNLNGKDFSLAINGTLSSITFSPDGTKIIALFSDGQVLLWDVYSTLQEKLHLLTSNNTPPDESKLQLNVH